MSGPGREELVRRFTGYVDGFLSGDPAADYHYVLKREHSLRVLENALAISRGEGLAPDVDGLVFTTALFHDTGRFPQFARHRTFSDRHSENHARLGVSALLSARLLEGLPGEVRRTTLGAVFLHNFRALPPKLREPLGTVARVVRDADKLDIYPVLLSHTEDDRPLDPVVSLGIRREPGRYTEALLDQLERRQTASYDQMVYENDFRLLIAGWVFDLNFRSSRRLLAERGYLPRILEPLPPHPRIQALRRAIEAELEKV